MIPLAERYRLPISQRTRILLVAIILVLLAGVAVAATQPGSLGDDGDEDRTAAELTTTTTTDDDDSAAQETTSTTESEAPETTTTTAGPAETEPKAEGDDESPGSGLDSTGSGSAGEGDLANTGGLPLALPGALLLVAAGLSRRIAAR